MANQLCACDAGLGNLGLPNCDQIFRAGRKFIFVPRYSAAGVENSITPSGTINLAWITALINQSDKSLRYYFTPELKNIDLIKGDPTMETFEDKSSTYIVDDIRKVSAIIPKCPPRFKDNFEQIRCNTDTCFFEIDLVGNIIGCQKYADGKLYPIPLNTGSAYAGVVMAKDGASQQMHLAFEIPNSFDDSTLCMIKASAFPDFNFNNIPGLLDGNVTFSASGVSSTVITATITTPGADLFAPIMVEGLVVTDFVSSVTGATSKIRDTTGGADVAIASVVESLPGVYTITFTSTVTSVMVLLAKINGYDFFNMRAKSFTTL